MSTAASPSCEHCGAAIAKDDVAQGLAVRVDGRLTCANCVDALPGEAVVRINRLRALRGLGHTTYALPRGRHPDRVGYTFTTAAMIAHHRRQLQQHQPFEAPPMPAARPLAATPAARAASRYPGAPGDRRRLRVRIAASAVGLACLAVAGGLLLGRGAGHRLADRPAPPAPTAPQAPVERARTDYPVDPLRAWTAAANDPACDDTLLRAIADELIIAADTRLTAADAAVAAGDAAGAETSLDAVHLPDHLWFRATRARTDALRARVRSGAARTPPTLVDDAAPAPTRPRHGEPPKPADAADVAATAPSPHPPRAATTPVIAPAPTATAPPPPAADVVASASERSLIAAKDLWTPGERGEWRKTTTGVKLDRATGDLVASLDLAGGRYQAWVDARSDTADGMLVLSLGALKSEVLAPAKGRASRWLRFAPDAFELPAGSTTVRLIASGKGWQIDRLWIAGVDAVAPSGDAAPAEAQPPRFTPAPPPVPPPVANDWEPRFIGPGAELDALDERNHVPTRPGGVERVFASAVGRPHRLQLLTLDLRDVDAGDGGLVVVLHANRADRAHLQATIIDQDNKRWQRTVDLGADWTPVPFDLRESGLALDRLASLALEDVAPNLTTPFLLGPVLQVANQAPTADLLPLRPPSLIAPANHALDDQLASLALKRRSRDWRKVFDPTRIKVLVGPQLLLGDWDTQARPALRAIIGLKPDESLPAKTIEALVMQDLWLNALFDGPEPVIDRERHHVVLIATAGIEFPIGLKEPQAFVNFWKKAIDVCCDHGVLPVVVLGPSKVDPGAMIDAERLWQDVEEYVRSKRPGIPMIDLRPARARDFRHFQPGQARLAAELFGDGCRELVARLRWLQKPVK